MSIKLQNKTMQQYKYIDEDGNPVDKDGNPIDEDGNPVNNEIAESYPESSLESSPETSL